MTDADTVAELRVLLAERDAEIAEMRAELRKTVERLLWEAYRIGKPPWQKDDQ